MGLLESISLEHTPPSHSVHAAVFRDVANTDFLQQQLLGRNPDFEYAFVDASSVVSRLQVLAAVFKAITTQTQGSMRTPNLHSEIVCSLSPTNNISESYRRFGISPSTKHIIIIKVLVSEGGPAAPSAVREVEAHLEKHVQGKPVPFEDSTISQYADWAKIRKYYKLNGVKSLDGIQDEPSRRKEMEMLVLGSMALRGV